MTILARFELCTLLDYLLRARSLVPRPFFKLGSMAKLEGVEKALRKAAESIGITQLKDEQKNAIPINAQVIHAEITSCKHCY